MIYYIFVDCSPTMIIINRYISCTKYYWCPFSVGFPVGFHGILWEFPRNPAGMGWELELMTCVRVLKFNNIDAKHI